MGVTNHLLTGMILQVLWVGGLDIQKNSLWRELFLGVYVALESQTTGPQTINLHLKCLEKGRSCWTPWKFNSESP